ncbi:type IV pilin protein [Chitinibacteraceae bacterium HSL-7]
MNTRFQRTAKQRGFTLIELMIVIAIISILAAIAIPAYSGYVERAQLTEAQSLLTDMRSRMEQYYNDNRSYGYTDGNGNCSKSAAGATSVVNFASAEAKYFTYSCAVSDTGQGYTITATGALSHAAGYIFNIDESGAKGTTKYKGSTVNKACWLIRGSEC